MEWPELKNQLLLITTRMKDKVKSGLLLNVVIRKGAPILHGTSPYWPPQDKGQGEEWTPSVIRKCVTTLHLLSRDITGQEEFTTRSPSLSRIFVHYQTYHPIAIQRLHPWICQFTLNVSSTQHQQWFLSLTHVVITLSVHDLHITHYSVTQPWLRLCSLSTMLSDRNPASVNLFGHHGSWLFSQPRLLLDWESIKGGADSLTERHQIIRSIQFPIRISPVGHPASVASLFTIEHTLRSQSSASEPLRLSRLFSQPRLLLNWELIKGSADSH